MPSQLGNTFLGTGNDEAGVSYTNADTNFKGGFYLKDDFMGLQVDVVNYDKTPKKIYVTFDVEYLPGKTGPDAASVLLSLTGCRSPAFMLVDKEAVMESDSFTVFEDGGIINASEFCETEVDMLVLILIARGPLTCKSPLKIVAKGITELTMATIRTAESTWSST